jgi:hypothetical protein
MVFSLVAFALIGLTGLAFNADPRHDTAMTFLTASFVLGMVALSLENAPNPSEPEIFHSRFKDKRELFQPTRSIRIWLLRIALTACIALDVLAMSYLVLAPTPS